jgi:hypothetical protein
VIGILLLLGPIRALARIGIVRNLQSRLVTRATRPTPAASTYDVDSTAREVDPPTLRR